MGPLKIVCLPAQSNFTFVAHNKRMKKKKSQLLVWGAAIITNFFPWGNSNIIFQPKILRIIFEIIERIIKTYNFNNNIINYNKKNKLKQIGLNNPGKS